LVYQTAKETVKIISAIFTVVNSTSLVLQQICYIMTDTHLMASFSGQAGKLAPER